VIVSLGVGGFAATPVPPSQPMTSPEPPITPSEPSRQANRLAGEKSPYLLQHQWNPVDWYPWGPEAFERARRESKPILLSIGYSTCHWCHVMERESFEDQATADFLKAHFVSIKVDREERPDVDKIYMTFVQSTTGQGGWPLNVFLTPDLKPFYGGTYFPPEPRHGRPSFLQLLRHIQQLWDTRQADVVQSSADLHQRLATFVETEANTDTDLARAWVVQAVERLQQDYDPRHGGFGGAPKFPRPSQPILLLRASAAEDESDTRRQVIHTCDRMAAGGIADQLEGGFHRYAVDAEWLVPHFEKMLYDNAQLANLYLEAFLATGQERHAQVVRSILDYVVRDMTHSEGGFFSAEDADSEGHEGKFYCWTEAELSQLLTRPELKLVVRRFGITERGNFTDHSHPDPLPGQNVLSLVDPVLSVKEEPLLESALRKMRERRRQRVRPHRDDKVLASWNGLMLGAFARAAIVLDEPAYLDQARKNLAFLRRHLWDSQTQTLYHRWRDGERDRVQLLDAYAYLLSGVLDLYEATLEGPQLEFAVDLADAMIDRFGDPERGGFYQSASEGDLILRLKEDYDGAEPSGNSVAALSLLRLSVITDRARYRDLAEGTLRCFAPRLQERPEMVPHLLQALDFALEEKYRVVIATPEGDPTVGLGLLRAAHLAYQPNRLIVGQTGPVDAFARELPANEETAVAYVCTGNVCLPPTSDVRKLAELLTSRGYRTSSPPQIP